MRRPHEQGRVVDPPVGGPVGQGFHHRAATTQGSKHAGVVDHGPCRAQGHDRQLARIIQAVQHVICRRQIPKTARVFQPYCVFEQTCQVHAGVGIGNGCVFTGQAQAVTPDGQRLGQAKQTQPRRPLNQ